MGQWGFLGLCYRIQSGEAPAPLAPLQSKALGFQAVSMLLYLLTDRENL